MEEVEPYVIIQRHYRTRQVKKAIKVLKYGKNIIENTTFEDFIIKIQDKKVLAIVNYILTKITRISKYREKNILTSQDFLSAFVIYGYTDDIIDKEVSIIVPQHNINKIIVKIAKELVETVDNFLNEELNVYHIIEFNKLLTLYKNIFDAWKTKDHKQLIHKMTTAYYEIESAIEGNTQTTFEGEDADEGIREETDSLTNYIDICRQQQEDIINKIIYLNGQEYFNNYKHEEVTLDENIQKQIKETVYIAFWNLLYEELNSKPPIHDKLISLLTELRDTFCNFVQNRTDIHKEIHEKIDVDLIKNMIENDAFDDKNLYNLAVYIISLIKRFQPAIMDEDVNKWEKSMLQQFTEKFEYSDFLVTFFKSVFNMIENIGGWANKFMEEYGEDLHNSLHPENMEMDVE